MFTELGKLFSELGEMFPELGELFPELDEMFPELGELFLELGELFPELGVLFPELGELFPELGELFTEFGVLFPKLGELFPELGELFTEFGKTPFSGDIAIYNIYRNIAVLYNIYVPVINFDRAQFLTETRANIVDVQLCIDFVKCLTTSGDPIENRWRPHMGSRPTGWEPLQYRV